MSLKVFQQYSFKVLKTSLKELASYTYVTEDAYWPRLLSFAVSPHHNPSSPRFNLDNGLESWDGHEDQTVGY
jgi:hypothetical protein